MPQPALELADIFRLHGPAYRQAHSLPQHQLRLMQAIETCRTPALGGVVEECDHCHFRHIRYRSCRNPSPRSPSTTKRWFTKSSSASLPKPCSPSPVIRNGWAWFWASSVCSTVGDRTCTFIPTYTV